MKIRTISYYVTLTGRLLVLMVVFVVLAERGVRAQALHNAKAVAAKPITLDLYNVSLADALTACCQQAGCRYRFSDAIKGFAAHERRTLHVQKVPFETVLEALLVSGTAFSRYSYHQIGNVFLIEGRRVSVDLKQAPPAAVLAALMEDAEANYAFSTEALRGSPMDFVVSALPLERALAKFFACAALSYPLKYTTTTGVFVFFNRAFAQRRQALPKYADPLLQDRRENEQVAVKFKNVECSTALCALFQAHQRNFVISVPVTGKVSLEEAIPFRIILDKILRSENAELTYMVNLGMFTIVKRATDTPHTPFGDYSRQKLFSE